MDSDFSDVRRYAAELGGYGPRVVKQARVVVEVVTRGTERDAKILAPVDTGNLRNSIGSDIDGLTGEVGPTANYGEYVEDGTSRMAPQPFMGPATDRWSVQFVQAMNAIRPEGTR